MPDDIRVTAELNDLGDHWTAYAYGGRTLYHPIAVTSEAPTRDEVETKFIDDWNTADGTSWTRDQFSFWVNEG